MTRRPPPIIRPLRTVRGQLTLLIGLFGALPPLVIIGLGFVALQKHELSENRVHMAELGREYSKRMDNLLNTRLEEVANLHKILDKREPPAKQLQTLSRELKEHAAFAAFSLVTADGRVLTSTRHATIGEVSAYAACATRAMESGAAIGRLSDDETEGGLIVPIAVHVDYDHSDTDSILIGTLLWSDLFSVIHDGAEADQSGRMERFVVFADRDARVVAAPALLLDILSPLQTIPGLLGAQLTLEQLPEEKILELGGANYRVVSEQRPKRAGPSACSIESECQDDFWSVTAVVFEDVNLALAPVRSMLFRVIVLVCPMLALGAAAAWYFAKRMTRQFDRLMLATRALADGRSVGTLPVISNNEVGTLTNHFNEMSTSLAESRAILEQHASNLEETNLKLRELDQTRTRLMANVSHEMCTPIAAMIAAARIILRHHRDKPDSIPRFGKVIVEEGTRLSSLVNEALELAELQSSESKWNDETVGVARLIRTTVESIKSAADARGIVLDYQPSGSLPRLIADPKRLQQVIEHLIDNAVTFTPKGGRVTVRSSHTSGRLELEVEDNGIGIAADKLDKIFLAFYQVQDADPHRDKPVGSGLGLAICQDIVGRYGGEIQVDSTPGRGSTFRVKLPLDTADGVDNDDATAAAMQHR